MGKEQELISAVKAGDVTKVQSLLNPQSGEAVSADTIASDGCPVLYTAAENGRQDIAEILLRAGAKVDLANQTGAAPLFVAAQNGHKDVVVTLLAFHANVDVLMNDGATPLWIAAYNGHQNVAEVLCHAGAHYRRKVSFSSTLRRFGLFSEGPIGKRKLGAKGPIVSMIGLGCMGMSEFYGQVNIGDSIATLRRALRLGCNFFDTANIYGFGDNERLLGTFLFLAKIPREAYVIATKCGVKRDPQNLGKRIIDNSPEHIKESCRDSLRRLRLDYIDLYYLHRIENNGEHIEDSMQAMADLLAEGKIHYVGLSEPSKEIIERANSALMRFTAGKHQITAVETEYSLMSRTPEIDGTMQICRGLGIAFVPYAPLGRQYLTALDRTADKYDPGDCRRIFPRFQGGDSKEHNQIIVKKIVEMAGEKMCTPAQLCLAWVLAQGDNIIPIPGTKHIQYLEENLLAARVKLTGEDLHRLNEIAPIGSFLGTRYPEQLMQSSHLRSEKEVMEEHVGKKP